MTLFETILFWSLLLWSGGLFVSAWLLNGGNFEEVDDDR